VLISSGTTLVGALLDDNEIIDDVCLRFSCREQCASERDKEKKEKGRERERERERKKDREGKQRESFSLGERKVEWGMSNPSESYMLGMLRYGKSHRMRIACDVRYMTHMR